MKWTVNELPVKSGARVDIQIYNGQVIFEIPFSVRSDTGRYTLTLENDLGKCSASAHVTVLGKTRLFYNKIIKGMLTEFVCVCVFFFLINHSKHGLVL